MAREGAARTEPADRSGVIAAEPQILSWEMRCDADFPLKHTVTEASSGSAQFFVFAAIHALALSQRSHQRILRSSIYTVPSHA